jgi:fumarylpyruvate hydrolase
VVAIGQGGRDIPVDQSQAHVWGYATGNDFTRRDLQGVAKKMGRPWDLAKGFDLSAACGVLHPVAGTGVLDHGAIRLSVDGQLRQDSDLDQMIWTVPEIIAHLSQSVELRPGDLIYTGTPAGVGAVMAGQVVRVDIDGLTPLETRIA